MGKRKGGRRCGGDGVQAASGRAWEATGEPHEPLGHGNCTIGLLFISNLSGFWVKRRLKEEQGGGRKGRPLRRLLEIIPGGDGAGLEERRCGDREKRSDSGMCFEDGVDERGV